MINLKKAPKMIQTRILKLQRMKDQIEKSTCNYQRLS